MTNKTLQKFIQHLYLKEGLTYREIHEKTGFSTHKIASAIKGSRSHSESQIQARAKGRGKLTTEGRLKLSESGKKACRRNRKYWTRPEQEFRKILNEANLGVAFPDEIKGILKEENDEPSCVCFQYPIQRYVCDFVMPEQKIVFQVNGDFWHANPILYDHDKLTLIQKHNVRQDKNRKSFLISRGWTICDVWESEIQWNRSVVFQKIRAAREQENPSVLHTEEARSVTGVAYSDWSEKLKKLWFKEPRPKKEETSLSCQQCGNCFVVSKGNKRMQKRTSCSPECAWITSRKVKRPSKVDLKEAILHNSWLALGRKYKVSDNAVRKWAKQYGLL